jgi:heat shock protein HslJ
MARRVAITVASLMTIGSYSQFSMAQQSTAPSTQQPQQSPLVVPQSLYVGELPCVDCAGMLFEVDLRERGIFFLRITNHGKEPLTAQYVFGRWSLTENQLRLKMLGGRAGQSGIPDQAAFAVQDANTLRKLDASGKVIQSNLNTLLRQSVYTPIEPVLRLHGMYSYRADSETFTECLTGISVPVSAEGQHADLQTAYSVARKEPGKFVFVEIDGRIALRSSEGAAKRNTLVVAKMGKFYPLRTCEASTVTHELTTTRWVPAVIAAVPVTLVPQQREPFIVLQSGDRRITGFSGCNQLSGSYHLAADELKILPAATTRMACAQGMDIEQRLLKALEATASWRIEGDRLDLLDKQREILAIFKSANP